MNGTCSYSPVRQFLEKCGCFSSHKNFSWLAILAQRQINPSVHARSMAMYPDGLSLTCRDNFMFCGIDGKVSVYRFFFRGILRIFEFSAGFSAFSARFSAVVGISVNSEVLTETLATGEKLTETAENPAENSNILRIPRKKKR